MQTSGLLRNMRNVVHNYTEVEIKVREATSNDPWGPSSSIMAEIADLTYNPTAFPEIMGMLWKRLSDHGKNWRHVYKSLMLIDYLVKTGSERVSNQCKENIYAIQTLKDFQYMDARDSKDHGANVRERAKQLVTLLKDDERLRVEREKALQNKERFAKTTTGIGSHSGQTQGFGTAGGFPDGSTRPTVRSSGEEELQLQLALAMSKEEADDAEKLKREDEVRVELAISESLKNDEIARQKATANNQPPPAATATAPTSAVDDLLSLDIAPSNPPPQNQNTFDPWGTGGGAQNTDPFGVPQQVAAADPFGGGGGFAQSPQVSADPWGQSAAAANPMSADPWGQGPPAQVPVPVAAVDPFSGSGFGGSTNISPSQDPFGAPAQQNNSDPFGAGQVQQNNSDPFGAGQVQHSNDPFGSPQNNDPFPGNQNSDPFSSAGNNNNPSATNDLFSLPSSEHLVEHKNPPFDMGGLGGALLQTNEPQKKSAQSFLGSASGLVNLDALVSRPKQQVAANPFGNLNGSSPTGFNNPFHTTTPGLSMNELAMKNQASQLGLQQPMAPSPVGGMNPMFGQSQPAQPQVQSVFGAPMMSGNNWAQPQKQQNAFGQSMGTNGQQNQSNNPFL